MKYFCNVQQHDGIEKNNKKIITIILFSLTIIKFFNRILKNLSLNTKTQLIEEINMGRAIGAQGFPSLILKAPKGYQYLPHDYNDATFTLSRLSKLAL